MKRKEALQLVSSLLDPTTPIDEKQLAAARLSELIRILLPEEEKEEEMTQQEFNKMMDIYFDDLAKKNPNSWSAPYREWAEKNGIINGDPDGNKRYMSHVTREEAVKMIKEAIDLVK